MGKRIDARRRLQSLVDAHATQREAARALKISQPYLSDLLAGRRGFSEKMLAKLGLARGPLVELR